MSQRPRRRTGCIGTGCGSVLGIFLLLAIIGAATNKGGATATPKAAVVATSTSTPNATSGVASSTSFPAFGQSTPQPSNTSPVPAASPTPNPTPAPQVITVKENAVNVRQAADPNAPVIALLDAGSDAVVLSEDSTGTDGATRWVHVQVENKDGYVRSDLVSEHHVSTAAPPIQVIAANAPLLLPTATVAPTIAPTQRPPATVQSVPNSSSAAAITVWYSKHGTILTTLTSDLDAAGAASGNYDTIGMATACQRLTTDVRSDMGIEAIPDSDAALHFGKALQYFAAGAHDCIVGAQTLDATSLEKSATEIQLASGELTLATGAIRKYAG